MALDKSQSVFAVGEKVFSETVFFDQLSTIREWFELVGLRRMGWFSELYFHNQKYKTVNSGLKDFWRSPIWTVKVIQSM